MISSQVNTMAREVAAVHIYAGLNHFSSVITNTRASLVLAKSNIMDATESFVKSIFNLIIHQVVKFGIIDAMWSSLINATRITYTILGS